MRKGKRHSENPRPVTVSQKSNNLNRRNDFAIMTA